MRPDRFRSPAAIASQRFDACDDSRLESSNARLRARAGGGLYAVGGLLGFAALLLPGGSGTSMVVAVATSASALVLGLTLGLAGERVALSIYPPLALLATSLASVSAYYGGGEGWLNGFYYFWVCMFAAYFFTPVQVGLQLTAVALEYGLVASFTPDWQHPALVWLLTVVTLAVTTLLVARLRWRLEQALTAERRQVEELRQLDRLKNDFIATVSHELRTPVAAVYGAAETLRLRQLAEETREQLLGIVYSESDRLSKLTTELLEAVALERQTLPIEATSVDPAAVAKAAVEAARLRHGRNFAVEVEADLPWVQADSAKLRRVLANLLENAHKYSPVGTPIRLRLAALGSAVQISVSNEGEGIPPEQRERVFDKFHRLDAQMRHGVGGAGLGLYIVRGLVEAMDGRVWIEPTVGQGTTVTVELARSEATARPRPNSTQTGSGSRQERAEVALNEPALDPAL